MIRIPWEKLGRYGEILRHSGTYAFADMLARMVGFLMIPIYTRYLTQRDYGVLEMFDTVQNAVLLVFGVRIPQALSFFTFKAENNEQRHTAFSASVFATLLAAATILSLFVFDFAGAFAWVGRYLLGTDAYTPYLRLLLINIALSLPVELGMGALRVENRSGKVLVISLTRLVTMMLLNILFVVAIGLGFRSMLWTSFIVSIATCVAFYWIFLSPRPRLEWRWQDIRRQIVYALPLGLSAFSMFTINFGDRLFLARAVTLEQIGIYSLAYRIGTAVAFLHGSFESFWSTQLFRYLREPGGETLYARIMTYLLLVLFTATLLLFAFITPLLSFLAGPSFRAAAIYAPWVGLIYAIRGPTSGFRGILWAQEKMSLDGLLTVVGAAVCLIGYIVLIPRFQLWGAIAASLAGFAAHVAATAWFATRSHTVPFEWVRAAKIIAAFSCGVALHFMLPAPNTISQIGSGVAGVLAFLAVLVGTGFLLPSEKTLLDSLALKMGIPWPRFSR